MDTETLLRFVDAVQAHAWYAIFGYGCTLLIALARKWKPLWWQWVPVRLQWAPSMALVGLGAFVTAWATGLQVQYAVAVALWTMAVGGPTAVGTLHTVKRITATGSISRRIGPAALLLLLPGCAGSLEAARSEGAAARRSGTLQRGDAELSQRCRQLDRARTHWSAAHAAAAAFIGASGLGALSVEQFPEAQQDELYLGLGLAAAAGAAVAALTQLEADGATEAWARECIAP
jgi:hypothetical protein